MNLLTVLAKSNQSYMIYILLAVLFLLGWYGLYRLIYWMLLPHYKKKEDIKNGTRKEKHI